MTSNIIASNKINNTLPKLHYHKPVSDVQGNYKAV